MLTNKDFYPTPPRLIKRMLSKVKDLYDVKTVLEPSAGSGAIIDYMNTEYRHNRFEIMAIENDPTLRATLLGKKAVLIDNDFLKYKGIEQFDLIIANFPFSDGERHLNKALEVLYSGQIVCLINAETIRNPFSSSRKELVQKLKNLNAKIEYIKDAFKDADRKTGVEVALIHVHKDVKVETHLFDNMKSTFEEFRDTVDSCKDLATKDGIMNLVRGYDRDKEILTRQLVDFYKNYKFVGNYLELSVIGMEDRHESDKDLTTIMQNRVNQISKKLKKDYWLRALELEEIKKRLTSDKKKELLQEVESYSKMDFTEENIMIFITNLVEKFPKMIEESIVHLFDKFTSYALRDSRWGNDYTGNIHYFSAWKANDGYKVNKKVILPFYNLSYSGTQVSWENADLFSDIERVVGYFAPGKVKTSMVDVCNKALKEGMTRKIETDLFYISFFKKGTVHIEFKDEDVLRLFNIEACKLKNMLPMDYSEKDYADLTEKEKDVAKSFETSVKNYKKVPNKSHKLSYSNLSLTSISYNGDVA